MASFFRDVRFAWRMLAKNPGFTIVAILTLALGIGANVATFSIVYAILLRPLPFAHQERLVRVFDDLRGSNVQNVGMSVPEMWDFQRRSGVFEDISAVWPINADLTGGDRPERIEALATSPNYFTLLGAQPRIGRVYTQAETVPGFLDAVVLSDGFWRREFGADPNILGKKVRLDNDPYTVVAVMPPDFRHPGRTLETDVDAWIAAGYDADPFPHPAQRSIRMIPGAVARLKPGLTVAEAQARLETYSAQLSAEYPTDYPPAVRWAPRLVSIQEDLVGKVRTELFVLFGAVACVLLIACVNLANLLLSRSAGRQREIAVRLALGAGRKRLLLQMLTESMLLSIIAGAIALVTVVSLKASLLRLAPANLPRLSEVNLSGGVLLFAVVVSISTGILFGLVPALQASNANQISSLREGSRGSGSSRSHTLISRGLVISEIALSLILLVGAGLLLRSFWRLLEVQPGFNPHGIVTAQIWMPVPNNPSTDPYRAPEKRTAFLREVVRRVGTIPGVEAVAIGGSNSLPMGAARNAFPFVIEGRPLDSERAPVAEFAGVSPNYFDVLGTPLIQGRVFLDSDEPASEQVAIIDQTLANRYWPGENPLGKHIQFFRLNLKNPWTTIVGVVGDMKSDGFDAPIAPHIYIPAFQGPPYASVLFLRTHANTGMLGDQIRAAVQSVDSNLPLFGVRTMDEVITRSMAERRFALEILAIFAGVALLLAAIGIYGVMSYTFSRRIHEIGIRVALGAQRVDILRMALGEGMRLVVLGLIAGLIGAAALTRFLRSLLFNVTATDPVVFVAIATLLAAVALLACYIPSRRATRVDPLVALREE
ncbi:MAG: ABC transporter permease [Candidatus Acidiferrales bacterium]|jgi:predicted permease